MQVLCAFQTGSEYVTFGTGTSGGPLTLSAKTYFLKRILMPMSFPFIQLSFPLASISFAGSDSSCKLSFQVVFHPRHPPYLWVTKINFRRGVLSFVTANIIAMTITPSQINYPALLHPLTGERGWRIEKPGIDREMFCRMFCRMFCDV